MNTAIAQAEYSNANLLIVDDNPDNLNLLGDLLNRHGYRVRPVSGGFEAFQVLEVIKPDLILLDINMPGMNGFEVCQRLKANHASAHIPVIFISGANALEDKVRGFEVGGIDYITKPFEEKEVLIRIDTHLRLHFLKRDLEIKIRELEKVNSKVRELSIRDELTGLYNRRYFNEEAPHLLAHARRYQEPLSFMVGDIDFFKTVNDRFSHAIGDQVLRRIASIISNNIRDADLAVRYGGEEFVIAFTATPLPEAVKACNKLRSAIERDSWQTIHPKLKVTMSMGLSADLDVANHEQIIAAADKKLYEAKRDGKNCVRF